MMYIICCSAVKEIKRHGKRLEDSERLLVLT